MPVRRPRRISGTVKSEPPFWAAPLKGRGAARSAAKEASGFDWRARLGRTGHYERTTMWWDSLPRKDTDKLNCNSLPRKPRNGHPQERQQSAGSKASNDAGDTNRLKIADNLRSLRDENLRPNHLLDCAIHAITTAPAIGLKHPRRAEGWLFQYSSTKILPCRGVIAVNRCFKFRLAGSSFRVCNCCQSILRCCNIQNWRATSINCNGLIFTCLTYNDGFSSESRCITFGEFSTQRFGRFAVKRSIVL